MQLSKVVFGLNLESLIIAGEAVTACVCTPTSRLHSGPSERSELMSEQFLSMQVSSRGLTWNNKLLASWCQMPHLDPRSQSISIQHSIAQRRPASETRSCKKVSLWDFLSISSSVMWLSGQPVLPQLDPKPIVNGLKGLAPLSSLQELWRLFLFSLPAACIRIPAWWGWEGALFALLPFTSKDLSVNYSTSCWSDRELLETLSSRTVVWSTSNSPPRVTVMSIGWLWAWSRGTVRE